MLKMSMMHGEITIARIAGERWPRILSVTLAACYVKLSLRQFWTIPEYNVLIRPYPGVLQGVDRFDLDAVLEKFKAIETKGTEA